MASTPGRTRHAWGRQMRRANSARGMWHANDSGQCQDAFGLGDMQPLDKVSVEYRHALALRFGIVERGDHALRMRERGFVGRKYLVGSGDRAWMNEGLAVETEHAALPARTNKAVGVGDVEMDAIEHGQAIGAGGKETEAERGRHRLAQRRLLGMDLFRQIGRAH